MVRLQLHKLLKSLHSFSKMGLRMIVPLGLGQQPIGAVSSQCMGVGLSGRLLFLLGLEEKGFAFFVDVQIHNGFIVTKTKEQVHNINSLTYS